MKIIDNDLIFKELSLFAAWSDYECSVVKERCEISEYKKGRDIYKENSPADAFYYVILGRVLIYTQDKNNNEIALEYLHRGKYFGIISLLTGQPHSVSARAVNDCLVLVIKKDDFDFILKEIPKLAIDLNQTLSRRIKNKDIHQKAIFESLIISVFSSYSQAGKAIYAINLAIGLSKEAHKDVVVLDIASRDAIHSLPVKLDIEGNFKILDLSASLEINKNSIKDFILDNKFGISLVCLYYSQQDQQCAKNLLAVLSYLVNDYHYIILSLPFKMDRTVLGILNQSDLIHILTSSGATDLKKSCNLIERLKKDFNFTQSKIKVIINEYELSKIGHKEKIELLKHNIFANLPKIEVGVSDRLVLESPDSEYAKAVRRISREIGDCAVGLALGAGGAYGFCHIGVLKVIEEENIPVDIISGASIAAFIASLWATGRSSAQILEIAKEFKDFKYACNLMDFNFPFLGFVKGNNLYKFLKKYLGNKTFYDAKLPLKIIASDVKKGEPKILDKGLLVDAIMASCAMPGVFRPFKLKEEILFDTGIINPLPTEVLFKEGVKKIIAVNVTPSRQDVISQYERMEGGESAPESHKSNRLNLKRYLENIYKTNIIGIIFSSMEFMQSEIAQKEAQLADVVLHPNIQGLNWLELHRAGDFAKRGEEEARRNSDMIRKIIYECAKISSLSCCR